MTLHAALPSASSCASAAGDGAGESNVVVAVARGDDDAAIAVATELSGAGVAREVRVARGPVGGARVLESPRIPE